MINHINTDNIPLSVGEPHPGSWGYTLTGTVNGTEPLLMLLVTHAVTSVRCEE